MFGNPEVSKCQSGSVMTSRHRASNATVTASAFTRSWPSVNTPTNRDRTEYKCAPAGPSPSSKGAVSYEATMGSAGQQSESLNIQHLVDSIPALILTGRPDGYLDYFNKPWLDYLGATLDDVTGWKWLDVIHPEDVEGIVAKW